jgi:phenylalanyl-tRNA synthetase beta chain
VGQGLVEAYSHTLGSVSYFDDPDLATERVTVRSSLSTELSGLRLTLLPHLLDALSLNLRHGAASVRLFEVGKVFRRASRGFDEPRHVAGVLSGDGSEYKTAKGVVENLFNALRVTGVSFRPSTGWSLHPARTAEVFVNGDRLGYVAEIDPYAVLEHLELPPSSGRIAAFELDAERLRTLSGKVETNRYSPIPKFPAVTRDLALLFDLSVTYGSVEQTVRIALGELLEDVELLSVYTGDRVPDGKKSVAIRLSLRSMQRTLTDHDAEIAVTAARDALTNDLEAELR